MIEIRCVKDLKEAERVWRLMYSTKETIINEWEYRYCFYKYQPYSLFFYVAYDVHSDGSEEVVGLMPLQYNPESSCLEFIAEDPCWENRVFVKPGFDEVIPKLYENLSMKSKFWCLSGEDEYTTKLAIYEYVYKFSLTGLSSFDDLLHFHLSPKRRKSLIKDIERVEQNNKIEFSIKKEVNNAEWNAEFDVMFKFNSENIEESFLKTEAERLPRRDFIKLPYDWRLVVMKIAGETQAVSLSVVYGNQWQYLLTGVNHKKFPGLGKLLVKKNIEEAIKEGAEVFDAGMGDCHWKKLWHFDQIPQYEFIKEMVGENKSEENIDKYTMNTV